MGDTLLRLAYNGGGGKGGGAVAIRKIVVTGGPCGGKTTALSRIQHDLSHLGYTVLTVPETATSLISNGVTPWDCGSTVDYQRCQMRLQRAKELAFEEAAATMGDRKILIVCDRGMMDNKAYMLEDDFYRVLEELNMNEMEQRENYDAVFHLVTAAKDAEEFYTLENNGARIETVEEAAELDDRFIAAWAGHPHLRVIDNRYGFEGKMRWLMQEITYFLGEASPYEIRRKYLVEYPDVAWLESMPNCNKVEIEQTYLHSNSSHEVRIRRRTTDGHSMYYLTEKRYVGSRNLMRTQRRISAKDYNTLMSQADPSLRQIRKTRYCLACEGQYFEIDLFPCWDDQAIVEIELSKEDTPVFFPAVLRVIREITEDPAYRNAVIASLPCGATH